MSGPAAPVAAVRVAVRVHARRRGPGDLVLVACSGGADSLALAAATAFEAPRAGVRAGALVIDHGLQEGSAQIAERAGAQCESLGLRPVRVERVRVHLDGSGPEAAARTARHAKLGAVAAELGAARIWLAHSRDDQAEQVLLGLARGSGARSLAGMPVVRGVIERPLLDLPRATLRAACAAQGLHPFEDPHNQQQDYRRVRVRRLLADLECDLGPGITAALARSAALLRADADALEQEARAAHGELGPMPWPAEALAALPPAVRARIWRLAATAARASQLRAVHVQAMDALVTDWHGQGPVDLPGGLVVYRSAGAVGLRPAREAPPLGAGPPPVEPGADRRVQ